MLDDGADHEAPNDVSIAKHAKADRSKNGAGSKNDAVNMVARGNAEGPPQFSLAVHEGKWRIAATGTAAGLVASVGGLGYLLMFGDPLRILGIAVIAAFVGGGCAAALVTHARLADIRRHLAYAHSEIDRKAKENAKLLDVLLDNPGSSESGKQKLPDVIKGLGPSARPKPKRPRKEGK